jgi:hypothetical protein
MNDESCAITIDEHNDIMVVATNAASEAHCRTDQIEAAASSPESAMQQPNEQTSSPSNERIQ